MWVMRKGRGPKVQDSPTENSSPPSQTTETGLVTQPLWTEALTTTWSIALVQRVEASRALAFFTRFPFDSMEVTSTPETSSPHSAARKSPRATNSPGSRDTEQTLGLPLLAQDDPDLDLLLFRGHPAVGVAADGAADDGVAGFVHEEMLAFLAAGWAGEGDMHFI